MAKNKKIIFLLIIAGVLVTNSTVLAKLLVNWPPSPLGTPLTEESTLPDLIKYLYGWAIGLGGLAAFIVLIIAGFQYLTSTGDPTKMREAMARIQSAGLGLVLLLTSVLILNTINPALTTLRPLTLDLESLQAEVSCNNTDECQKKFGKNYACCLEGSADGQECQPEDNNKCVPILEIKVTQCEKVTIYPEESEGCIVSEPGKSWSCSLNAGESFRYETEPPKCMGILELYPSSFWTWCRGDQHTIYISGPKGKGSSPEVTRCVKLKEVPEF